MDPKKNKLTDVDPSNKNVQKSNILFFCYTNNLLVFILHSIISTIHLLLKFSFNSFKFLYSATFGHYQKHLPLKPINTYLT